MIDTNLLSTVEIPLVSSHNKFYCIFISPLSFFFYTTTPPASCRHRTSARRLARALALPPTAARKLPPAAARALPSAAARASPRQRALLPAAALAHTSWQSDSVRAVLASPLLPARVQIGRVRRCWRVSVATAGERARRGLRGHVAGVRSWQCGRARRWTARARGGRCAARPQQPARSFLCYLCPCVLHSLPNSTGRRTSPRGDGRAGAAAGRESECGGRGHGGVGELGRRVGDGRA
jgi:hypothetical protein